VNAEKKFNFEKFRRDIGKQQNIPEIFGLLGFFRKV